jgi:hypothetical protein
MTEGSDARRPHDREHEPAPEDQGRSQDELARQRPDSGGDADAAGTVEEREALAADEDETWTGDGD